MVEWLFFEVPWGCLRFVIVIVPDHTHVLFLMKKQLRQEMLAQTKSTVCLVSFVSICMLSHFMVCFPYYKQDFPF